MDDIKRNATGSFWQTPIVEFLPQEGSSRDTRMKGNRSLRKQLLHRDAGRCGIHLGGCGRRLSSRDASVDHIFPKQLLSKELPYWRAFPYFELQPMCASCNKKKDSRFPLRLMPRRCTCCLWVYVLTYTSAYGKRKFLPISRHIDVQSQEERSFFAKYDNRVAIVRMMARGEQLRAMLCYLPTVVAVTEKSTGRRAAEGVLIPMRAAGIPDGVGATERTGGIISLEEMLESNELIARKDLNTVLAFTG